MLIKKIDVFGGNEAKIITMLDAIKVWADVNYAEKTTQLNTSAPIAKNSGWRASAMMDHPRSISDEGF